MCVYRICKIIVGHILKYFFVLGDNVLTYFVGSSSVKSGVLLVRVDAIGDFILWLDTAKEYRRLYPGRKITLIANKTWASLATRLYYWDDVWLFDREKFVRNPLYRWKLLYKINQARFELAIQPTFSRELLLGDSIIRASAANKRIGSIGDLSNMSSREKVITNSWYTNLISAVNSPMMELNRNAEFLSHFIGKKYFAKIPKLHKIIDLPQHLNFSHDYFIIFPGASWIGKQWHTSSFAACLDKLSAKYGWKPILCGSTYDFQKCCSIIEQSKSVEIINLAGRTSLSELIEIIRNAKILIGNDTSAIHIASAVSTPSVCILGGGHFGRFMPYSRHLQGVKPLTVFSEMPCYGCNWKCSQPHKKESCVPCISQIGVESVMQGVEAVLKSSEKYLN